MICTYGTLRKGMPNFKHYKAGLEYLKTIELKGYRLWRHKTLPLATRTGLSADTIVCDLLYVENTSYSKTIDMMELGAEYFIDVTLIDGEPYKLYLYDHVPSGAQRIPDGDWKKFAENNNLYVY